MHNNVLWDVGQSVAFLVEIDVRDNGKILGRSPSLGERRKITASVVEAQFEEYTVTGVGASIKPNVYQYYYMAWKFVE